MTVPPIGETTYSPKFAHQAMVRRQISQGGTDLAGVKVFSPPEAGKAPKTVEPDEGSLSATIYLMPAEDLPEIESAEDPRGEAIATLTDSQINREGKGECSFVLAPPLTSDRGLLTIEWSYAVDGTTFAFTDRVQITEEMPTYNVLSEAEKFIVWQVSYMLGDLFDSTEGGAWLTENFQTHFTNERLAQLLIRAVQKFNFIGQPVTGFGVAAFGGRAVPSSIHGAITEMLYIETLRHLCRSYVEIPEFVGMNVTYTQRRDYLQRWQSILRDEEKEAEDMVKMAKRQFLGLGRGALLVSGGIYGGSGRNSLFRPGTYASQTRSWRMYPAAFAVSGFALIRGTGL